MADPPVPGARRQMAVPKAESPGPPSIHPIVPYLYVLAVAAIVALILAAYAWLYREEIRRIITSSPT